MRTSTVIDLLLAVLSDPHVSAALRVPAWLAALLRALRRALRRVLGLQLGLRLDRPGDRRPLGGPRSELAREHVDRLGIAGHVGHLAAGQLGGPALKRRPASAAGEAPRDVDRPPLTTARRDPAQLREQPFAAQRAQSIADSAGATHARSSRPGPTAVHELVQARDSMPLSTRDLEQIRRIVREEVARALGPPTSHSAPSAVPDSDLEEPDPEHRAIAEFARWTVRAARGEPGAAEQEMRAEALYRGRYDASWRRRARRKLGMTGDEPLELDDALRALRLLKGRKSPAPR